MTEKRRRYLKKYRENNRKRHASRMHQWTKNNPEMAKVIKQRFAKKNPRYMAEYALGWRGKNYASYLCKSTKGRATKTGKTWTLTYEWFVKKLSVGRCEQTGIEFDFDFSTKHPFRPSVDRIDSRLGYTPENCQLVCCIFNLAKSNWTNRQVWAFIKKAASHKSSDRRSKRR